MAYITAEARQELLDTVAEATEELGVALGALGDAYEQLDERSADRLEEELFQPVQAAYARAKRTHTDFAARYGLAVGTIETASRGRPSTGVKGFLEVTADALERAENILVELQDSMSPVEVGDPELRAGLAEVRGILAGLSGRPQRFVSLFGR
jgi:hypothetical protein